MKQPNLNREWLEQYKTIPKENTSIYRNTYNPHESSIPGTPQSHFEKAMMPAYGVGTQQMEEQIRAHPAFASMPPSIRERPMGDVLNYFKQPEMVNRIKFNQDLEGIKNQRQTNYTNELSNLQTQHNQRMEAINSPVKQREEQINAWIPRVTQGINPDWIRQNNITRQDANDIIERLASIHNDIFQKRPVGSASYDYQPKIDKANMDLHNVSKWFGTYFNFHPYTQIFNAQKKVGYM